MWNLSLIRFFIGFIFLLISASMDLKTRRVRDELWIIMAVLGLSILVFQLLSEGVDWTFYLIFIPVIVLLSEAFIERPEILSEGKINFLVLGWFLLPVFTFTYQVNLLRDDQLFWSLVTIPVMMILAFIFYYFGIIYGGADAKAIIVLAVLVPFYPDINGITHLGMSTEIVSSMQILFPFTFVILLNSALLSLVLPVYHLFYNVLKGNTRFPHLFFGYKKRVDELEDSFVWPMEYYEDGELRIELFPRKDENDALNSLKKAGREEVWVSPKIPFLVFMFFGFILSFLIGNPLLHIF